VAYGAVIEHCVLAFAETQSQPIPAEVVRDQIRAVGVEYVIVSSDFGQVANGPVVAAFAHHLDILRRTGFSDAEMRTMIVDNPRRLLLESSYNHR
jgi:predicted metal-dependent phosphotriesterase family hydrolase